MNVVVVPAFNESFTIEKIVTALIREFMVVVVDDGSTDDTAERAIHSGAMVRKLDRNYGYDKALNAGLAYAATLDCHYVFTFDADGQLPIEALRGARSLLVAGADLVIGIRGSRARVSEDWYCWVSSRLWGVSDPLCGLKGFTKSALMHLLPFPRFATIGTFFVPKAVALNLNVAQLPLQTQARSGASRFGQGLKPDLKIVLALFLTSITWVFQHNRLRHITTRD